MTARRSLRCSKLDLSAKRVQYVCQVYALNTSRFSSPKCFILTNAGGIFLGTVVMKVIATDDDEENTANSKIFYSIDAQSNSAGMFSINPLTGEVLVQRNTLDREVTENPEILLLPWFTLSNDDTVCFSSAVIFASGPYQLSLSDLCICSFHCPLEAGVA